MAEDRVTTPRLIMIGGSAGSLEVIIHTLPYLPARLTQSVVIIVHRKSSSDSILEDLLSTKTSLQVKEVEDKEPIRPGTIYIAPPDYHLLIENKATFSLDASEKVHFSRPSIDVSFESAAEVFGPAVVGILLSGANADGARGLQKIERHGGVAIVQDPSTADVDYMPAQALRLLRQPNIVKASEIGSFLATLLKKV